MALVVPGAAIDELEGARTPDGSRLEVELYGSKFCDKVE